MNASSNLSDPRVPAREVCVVRYLLDRWAAERGDMTYVIFDSARRYSYREMRERAISVAVGLARLGVKQGDHVLAWQPTCPEMLATYYAINYLGAVFVPINTAYRGRLLEHVIENSDATLAVVHASLVERLSGIQLARLERLVVTGSAAPGPALLPITPFDDMSGTEVQLPPLARPIEPWDTQSVIYTSGTTGPSKGVMSSYLHMYTNPGPEAWPFVTGEDRFLVNSPMFHIGGMGLPFAMLARGGSIVLPERFSTDDFWPTVKEHGVTAIFLLGVMATFLSKAAPGPEDIAHKVRTCFIVPLIEGAQEFSRRFGVNVYTIFNMTEISSPIVSAPNPTVRGTCGKVRAGVEVRLVDENDCEVPIGSVGEMMLRTDRPWAMSHGYLKEPQATAKAWRNGWFHTGDAFRKDAEGNFFFVDRMKDSIRRRGENISSFEVEAEVLAHVDVRECAALGVPSELGEDEVMIVVAPAPGRSVDPATLIHFLTTRLAYFMVPRYVRTLYDLPKTPSSKVLKAQLRGEGITADTWDREKAGIVIRRDRL
jgi:crotonobetaine/carnitine-CoA ligase